MPDIEYLPKVAQPERPRAASGFMQVDDQKGKDGLEIFNRAGAAMPERPVGHSEDLSALAALQFIRAETQRIDGSS
jgi:hypothetical protein